MTTMREAWAHTLVDIAARASRTVVLDADLGTSTRADIFADAYPGRFFQMGIAEQHLMGAAAGMAQMGFTPWISSFGVFMTNRALDPLRMLVAQCRSNVKIVGSYTGLCFGKAGKTHHDHADLSVLRAMPNLVVLAPGDNAECAQMTRWANEHDGPVYLRLIREQPPELPGSQTHAFRPGAVRIVRDGSGVVLVSTASQTARSLDAAQLLESHGISARVVHVPSIKPLDEAALLEACAGVRTIVTVEDQSIYGGLGGMVAEIVAASANTARVHRIGLQDTWVGSGTNEYLLDHHGLSAEGVARQVLAVVAR
jgi:transketolase